MFRALGVPVYYADDEAKNILFTPDVAQLVKKALGESVFTGGIPDRAKIASVVF
jgi:dephospho-CoA kinase